MNWEVGDPFGVAEGGIQPPLAVTGPKSAPSGVDGGIPYPALDRPVRVTRGVVPTAEPGVLDVSRDSDADESMLARTGTKTATETEPLVALRNRLLEQLARLTDRPETQLTDAQRLTKHQIETRLIALYFLTDAFLTDAFLTDAPDEGLETLLEAIRAPESPGNVHSLLRAALYHDVGSEGLRDRVIASLSRGTVDRPFALANLELCIDVRNDGSRSRCPEYVFRPDEKLLIYSDVLNLSSRPDGDEVVSELEVEVQLLETSGRQRDRRRLGADGLLVDRRRVPRQANFFTSDYQLPMRLTPGAYRLVVIATDRNATANATTQQELWIQIKK